MDKHLVLLKSDLAFQKIEGSDFENSSILHLRYNYKLSDRFTWELTTSEKHRFYIGTLAKYEQEKLKK
jgi:hypothetical protein